uniref:Bet v I/Major latex protein domain-containing protein n=1 Tax=Kalanchoe fedtschenkoi TaxID=63787 RepID=A0A7N0UIC2_KALFE
MGIFEDESVIQSSIPPAKMFKAFVLDAETIMPKIVPGAVKSVEILEGSTGPGTVKLITFSEGGPFKSMKHKVDYLDKEKFTFGYSVIGGDILGPEVEKVSHDIKFEATPEGGSVCTNLTKYYTIGDFEMKEELIKPAKEKGEGLFKAFEAFVLANPDEF